MEGAKMEKDKKQKKHMLEQEQQQKGKLDRDPTEKNWLLAL